MAGPVFHGSYPRSYRTYAARPNRYHLTGVHVQSKQKIPRMCRLPIPTLSTLSSGRTSLLYPPERVNPRNVIARPDAKRRLAPRATKQSQSRDRRLLRFAPEKPADGAAWTNSFVRASRGTLQLRWGVAPRATAAFLPDISRAAASRLAMTWLCRSWRLSKAW